MFFFFVSISIAAAVVVVVLTTKKLETKKNLDVENTSYLSHTGLGARARPLLHSKPFVVGGLFNVGAFGAILAYSRIHEHQRAVADGRERDASSSPKSRQERRRTVADRSKQLSKARKQAGDAMRAMGAKVFVEKGRKVA